ncbi:MAG: proline--tRNA ligase [Phycisphaerales bacterium]|nr:MAG: proline--tRNA ligase [Phycisphaerales bacterium]
MRWTKFFIPTVRETPADAVAPSHRLMIRAGLIRQVAAGSYAYLPLGYRTLRKVENIVREEMNRAGAIELHMPAMQPVELWEETGRTIAMGPTLVRLRDQPWRKGTVLGPTHEEVVTDIARTFLNSYKQLPVTLYQIQTKFRDEQRPKSGVLRTREFLMKDAYSFDADKADLDYSYEQMYKAYCRIYQRCGLPYTVVEAESGPIGGDASHEFMVVTDAGEDIMARCRQCGYAANLERAMPAPVGKQSTEPPAEPQEVHTPDQRTIEEVTAFLKLGPERMIKTLIYKTDAGEAIIALVRGDHEINEMKLARAAGTAGVELADGDTIENLTGAPVGFAGPQGLNGKARMIADQAVAMMVNAASGANKEDYHVTGINPGRDFNPDLVADIRNAVEGDGCEKCGGKLHYEKCIEVGHVFKLGTKYSDSMKAHFLDEHGKSQPMIMGCYGIGLNRIVAAAIESHHDEAGIIWPMSIAPYQVLILALDYEDEEVRRAAELLYTELTAKGLEVLLDDRAMRPGPKFKDADLIGIPLRVVVGKKSLADGVVEIKPRGSKDIEKLSPDDAAERVATLVRSDMEALFRKA